MKRAYFMDGKEKTTASAVVFINILEVVLSNH